MSIRQYSALVNIESTVTYRACVARQITNTLTYN